jgi:hypothetical protein
MICGPHNWVTLVAVSVLQLFSPSGSLRAAHDKKNGLQQRFHPMQVWPKLECRAFAPDLCAAWREREHENSAIAGGATKLEAEQVEMAYFIFWPMIRR